MHVRGGGDPGVQLVGAVSKQRVVLDKAVGVVPVERGGVTVLEQLGGPSVNCGEAAVKRVGKGPGQIQEMSNVGSCVIPQPASSQLPALGGGHGDRLPRLLTSLLSRRRW